MEVVKPVFLSLRLMGDHLYLFWVSSIDFKYCKKRFLSPGQTESQVIASWKLALTCDSVYLRSLWSSSNLHASERKFFIVWPPNTSRRKSVSVLFSFVQARVQGCIEMAFLLLALNLRFRLATHRKFVFASSHFLTCVDLRLRLARALSGSSVLSSNSVIFEL